LFVIVQGLVTYDEFKRVFQRSDSELETRANPVNLLEMDDNGNGGGGNGGGGGGGSGSGFPKIPPKTIPELYEQRSKDSGRDEALVLTQNLIQNFKVKVNPVGQFESVWNSTDTNSKSQVSLWAPSMQTSMLQSNKVSWKNVFITMPS
jgi:hypothetical protein